MKQRKRGIEDGGKWNKGRPGNKRERKRRDVGNGRR